MTQISINHLPQSDRDEILTKYHIPFGNFFINFTTAPAYHFAISPEILEDLIEKGYALPQTRAYSPKNPSIQEFLDLANMIKDECKSIEFWGYATNAARPDCGIYIYEIRATAKDTFNRKHQSTIKKAIKKSARFTLTEYSLQAEWE